MQKAILFLLFSISFFTSASQSEHNHSLDKSTNRFIENKGQWDERIVFISELANATILVSNRNLIYQIKENDLYNKYMADLHDGKFKQDSTYYYKSADILLEFEGADTAAKPRGKFANTEKRNYLLGNDSTKWGRNVLSYSDIEITNLYPNIDFNLYHSENSIKYEFEVAPNEDYGQIKLKFTGQESLEIAKNGDLLIHNAISDIIEDKPIAYQYIKGVYKEVTCKFKKIDAQTIGFEIGKNYNKRYPLIIDPQLIFSTASGSTADNWGNTACLDNKGNLYSGGTVFGTEFGVSGASKENGFPTTFGAFQRKFQGGGTDIGILKFDSSGQNLIYATYIGGQFTEIPTSIITNDKQELFILGVTSSKDFPKAVNAFAGGKAFDPVGGYTFENGTDIIIIKLNSSGSDVIKSRYVGGPLNDGDNMKLPEFRRFPQNYLSVINYGDELRGEIIIDKEENIYVASSTNNGVYDFINEDRNQSTFFPTKNAFQPNFGGGFQDGVVFKVHYSLDSLVWGSYLGGRLPDAAYGLVLAKDNSVYVTGICSSPIFNRKAKSYKPDFQGVYDGYVAKITPDGKSINAYTYLGTPNKDASYFIKNDEEENIYVLGQTFGNYGHFPSTIYHNKNEGLFVHKLGAKLDTSYFYTTIGDTLGDFRPNISPTAFLVNECGNIFISGWGGASNYIGSNTNRMEVTKNAFKTTTDGNDFYMAVYLKDMDSLLYATYFGVDGVAEHVDGGTSRFSDQGIVYQSVCAGCGDGGKPFVVYPTNSTGAYPQQNKSANCNNGVFKYDLSSLNAKIGVSDGCGPLTQYFVNETDGGVDYFWDFGDGTNTLVFTKETIKHTYKKAGRYKVSLTTTDLTTCKRTDTDFEFVNVSDRLLPKIFADSVCKGEKIEWDKYADENFATYAWSPSTGLDNQTIKNPVITAADNSIRYFITLKDALGCERKDILDVFVPFFSSNLSASILSSCQHLSIPKIELSSNYTSNFIPQNLDWKINTEEVKTEGNKLMYTPPTFGEFKINVKANFKTCEFNDMRTVFLPQIKVPNIITPNQDSKNDVFKIEGLEAGGNWSLLIANRWGKEVFETDAYDNKWDANAVSAGTYFYELKGPNGDKCKGWLQVVK